MSVVIFDLDGTLVDSAPDIRAAVNRMLADEGIAPLSLETVVGFIGNGIPRLVELTLNAVGLDMARHAELTQSTLDHYNAASADLTRPYDGVMAALEALKTGGYRMGICTNKPEAPARDVIQALGMTPFFDVIIGGDSLSHRKPHAAPLLKTMTDLDGTKAVYVGDSEVDAETAKAAALPFALFTRGYRKGPVTAMPHDVAFDSFADLPEIVARLIQD